MKRKTKKPAKKSTKQLDENTSALVMAEYMVCTTVSAADIKFIEDVGGPLSDKQIALTFRIADVLGIDDCFEMAPRFQEAFKFVRIVFGPEKAKAA